MPNETCSGVRVILRIPGLRRTISRNLQARKRQEILVGLCAVSFYFSALRDSPKLSGRQPRRMSDLIDEQTVPIPMGNGEASDHQGHL